MTITAIIMAGGKGTRFASAAPKCLAPLPDGTTLLARLIAQLAASSIEPKICCSPDNFAALESFAKTIACSNCALGPLPALDEALSETSSEWLLLCLADIYFFDNPFQKLREPTQPCLLTGADISQSNTGWISRNGSMVKSISYPKLPNADLRWTGAFLFHKRHAEHLKSHANNYIDQPFENWINDLIEAGHSLSWLDAGAFANVNSRADYTNLLALAQPKNENHAIGCA